jgi:ABC-2 type transport system ATP-binding protein
MTDFAIEIRDLTKVYRGDLGEKGTLALDSLNCQIHTGEVYAFIGPNGAGKTTTIKCLTRLIHPTRGEIRIFGKEAGRREAMERIGYLPEQPQLYGHLSGREFLDFIGRLFNLPGKIRRKRIEKNLERVGLRDNGDTAIRAYSRGMVQRLGLAQALINDPGLLILDEPMASLDPVGRKDFRDLIMECKNSGKTIFFSSHILSDAEMIADRVAILHRGKLVTQNRMDEIIRSSVQEVEVTFLGDPSLFGKRGITLEEAVVQGDRIMVRRPEGDIPRFLRQVDEWGFKVVSVIPRGKSLESFFMEQVRR